MFLTVTNNGNEPFAAKFNGIGYTFSPKEPVTISADAARHIFGVGLADKTEILTRHGWLSHSSQRLSAMAKLDSFSFSIPNDNPADEPVVELASLELPAPDEKEQGSAPLQSGTGEEEGPTEHDLDESPEPTSILGNIPNFLKH